MQAKKKKLPVELKLAVPLMVPKYMNIIASNKEEQEIHLDFWHL